MTSDGPTSPRAQGGELDPIVKVKLDQFIAERSCSRKEIDEFYRQLTPLSPSDALEALEKLETALNTSNVRNTAAYLSGVIKRITQLTPGTQNVSIEALPPLFSEAQAILEHLYHAGAVRRGDIDAKQLMTLSKKSPEYQVLVLDTFRDRNLRGIRNMAAFFSSHQTQVEKDLRDNRLRLPRLGGPPPSRYQPPPHRSHAHGGSDRGGPHYGPEYPLAPPHHQRDLGRGYPSGSPPPQYVYHHPEQPHRGGPVPPSSALPPVSTPLPPKHYAVEQASWGIRVDEFQSLSPFAKYVHPATALRLQQLWDVDQNKLVSVLNEASWESLAGLDAVNGVAAVNECADAMKTAGDEITTINGIFLRIALKYPKRTDAPTLATIALAAADAAAALPSLLPLIAGGGVPPQEQYVPAAGGPAAGDTRGGGGGGPYGGPPPYTGGAPPSYGSGSGAGGPPYLPPPAPVPARLVQLPGKLGSLPPIVQSEIDIILRRASGLLKLEHFEGRPCDMMYAMGEARAMRALEDFGRNDPNSMRSPTAYLIGCIKKFSGDRDRDDGRSRGRGGGRGGRGDGGGRGGRGARERNYEPY